MRCPLGSIADWHVLGRFNPRYGKLKDGVLEPPRSFLTLMIGEAPGPQEDLEGSPFVGPAGNLLSRILDRVEQRTGPWSWYLTNLVACCPRPEDWDTTRGPQFRAPNKPEIKECRPRLDEIMQLTRPSGIVYWGAQSKTHFPTELPHVALKHPSYIIRQDSRRGFDILFNNTVNMLAVFIQTLKAK